MATGTGNLPNPGMAFTPFDMLTAEEMNMMVDNIESLATGSGIGDGAIEGINIADGTITIDKINTQTFRRKVGIIPGSTFATSGNKDIVVGFRPSVVNVTVLPSNSSNSSTTSLGGADSSGSQYYSVAQGTGAQTSRRSGTDAMCVAITADTGVITFSARFVQMTSNGFRLNVTSTNPGAFPFAYTAIE